MKKENYVRIQNRVGISNHEFLDSIHGFYYGVAVALVLIILLASISSCGVNDNNIESGIGTEQIYPASDQSDFKTTGIDPFLANYPDMSQSPVNINNLAGNLIMVRCQTFEHTNASGLQSSCYELDVLLMS